VKVLITGATGLKIMGSASLISSNVLMVLIRLPAQFFELLPVKLGFK